ncbi:biotin--[acetyl-CoA-carboxylase] ligase [Motilibacter aurantiacus]|uniref:biotin--[acetyl-CoA-carboxylase] ligase n=1 Tax=Motilibacter aurantiacus TaxID=2714955 RepID=UPI001408B168|nr:biotin--[acetyl-CoA-carboxylase] ligase [Motilibacter aurantiacus]NHC43868.1 biotin--[acetyl-CoA-carboxylase] ligase [Motilibacter aurantiacus]
MGPYPIRVSDFRPALRASELNVRLAGGLWDLEVVRETGSTNADLAARARDGAPMGTVLVADLQTAGRGRAGRSWSAPAGSSLAVSVLLRPVDVAAERWGWLPLMAGVAVVDVVRRVAGVEGAALKWPNDVVVGDRKLAGLLAERVDTPAGPALVLGMGLNTTLTAQERPVPTATSLLLEGATETDRTRVLVAVLSELAERYVAWAAASGDAEASGLAAAYTALCATIGRDVRVELPGGEVLAGRADAVDDEGRLVVDGRAVSAGDVVHVR